MLLVCVVWSALKAIVRVTAMLYVVTWSAVWKSGLQECDYPCVRFHGSDMVHGAHGWRVCPISPVSDQVTQGNMTPPVPCGWHMACMVLSPVTTVSLPSELKALNRRHCLFRKGSPNHLFYYLFESFQSSDITEPLSPTQKVRIDAQSGKKDKTNV